MWTIDGSWVLVVRSPPPVWHREEMLPSRLTPRLPPPAQAVQWGQFPCLVQRTPPMGGSGSGAFGERAEQLMPQSPETTDLVRRDLLRWGLVGASVVILDSGHSGHAGEMSMPGVERRVLKEVDADIPGCANIRIRDVIFQP